MRPLEWSDKWSVGLDIVDDDHKKILQLINRLGEMRREGRAENGAASVIASVAAYTDYHFRREERILEAVDFPELERHRAIHGRLKTKTNEFLQAVLEHPKLVDVEGLESFLIHWWQNHILEEDMAYRPYLAENPEAEKIATAE